MSGGSRPSARRTKYTIDCLCIALLEGVILAMSIREGACCGKTYIPVCTYWCVHVRVRYIYYMVYILYGRPLQDSGIVQQYDDDMHAVRTTCPVVLFSLVACEVAHCLSTIPGMI